MALNCLQCAGYKFEDTVEQIPGTFASTCLTCYLTNIHDEKNHMFGYIKRFSHDKQSYVFYAFQDRNMCILAQVLPGAHRIIDKFPKYIDVNDIRQSVLLDLVQYSLEQEKLLALPEMK